MAEEEEREKVDKSSVSLEDIKAVLKEQIAPLKTQLKDVVKEVNKLKSKEIAKALTPSSASKKDQPSTSASKPTKESVKRALVM